MEIIKKISELQKISMDLRKQGKTIGLVPTMGYFHEGHLSLMKIAKEHSDVVMTSLFVNPTQFAPNEDFETYPRDLERDRKLAEKAGTDYLFNPEVGEMYPPDFGLEVHVKSVTEKFEGMVRPAHFNGVATVVAKLFNAAIPDIAVFGQKDYQQALVIKKLVSDLNFGIKIIVAPIVREDDGLAMSSRNKYIPGELREKADIIYRAMEEARAAIENGERQRKIINAIMHKELRSVPEIRIDYASSVDAEDLGEPAEFRPGQRIVLLMAVYLGKTRLIDNMVISIPK